MTATKPLTSKDAVRFLTLLNPDLTNAEIQLRLDWLGLPECTTFLIAQIRVWAFVMMYAFWNEWDCCGIANQ
jgi:hypothetical protein